jgi:hypothetical protein
MKIILIAFFLFLSNLVSASDSLISRNLILKISPMQAVGYRFPLIAELNLKKKFSMEIGLGPTLGRQNFVNMIPIFEDSPYRNKLDKKNLGIHSQFAVKRYFSKDLQGHYLSLFYRYGYFSGEVKTNDLKDVDVYLSRHNLALQYGYQVLDDKSKFTCNSYFGVGVYNDKYAEVYSSSSLREDTFSQIFFLIGCDIGLRLF